jgi:hypothetical protein
MQDDCDVSQAEHTIALLSLTEVLGVQVAFDRLQDVVLELLRGKAVASWPKELRDRLAQQVGVEVATSDATR